METLGHSDIATTMNTYAHVLPELQHDAARKMDAFLTAAPFAPVQGRSPQPAQAAVNLLSDAGENVRSAQRH